MPQQIGVGDCVSATLIVNQAKALHDWISSRWPGATAYAEYPVQSVLESGQMLNGRLDLLLDTRDGWILIDHKSTQLAADHWDRLADEHGAQIGATQVLSLSLPVDQCRKPGSSLLCRAGQFGLQINRRLIGKGEILELESMAAQLEAHPDYRVLRRLVPRTHFNELPQAGLKRGVIVDTETTGTDTTNDEIIELGMVVFSYDPNSGLVHRVLETFSEFEQPSKPIPPESAQVHGITDEIVRGKRIDDERVKNILSAVDLVIAHNAAFDRAMLERRLPIFSSVSWGCSFREILWMEEGIGSQKLDYILNQFGLFHEAHRAEADCLAWAAADFKDTLLRCEIGGDSWLQDGSSAGNSRLKRSSWSLSAA